MELSKLVLISGVATLLGALLSVVAGGQPADPQTQSNVLPPLISPVPQQSVQQLPPASPSYPQPPTTPQSPPVISPVVPPPSIPLPSVHASHKQTLKAAYISQCNGQEGNAMFRSAPSLSPAVVLGVVPKGEFVYLTNKTALGDGVSWYEAIAPHKLRQNNDVSATNQDTRAGQTGWIAACFVSH